MARPSRNAKAEVPLDTKFVRALDGRFVFSSRQADEGTNPVIPCRTQSVSATEFIIASSQQAQLGESFDGVFDRIGPISGAVNRLVDGGFVVAISASEAERRSLAATIDWLKKRHTNLTSDHRSTPRFRTRGQRCNLTYGDQILECQLRDISVNGANLSAEKLPPVDTEVRIGNVTGRVVRHAGQSFGVYFETRREVADLLKELLAPTSPGQ